MRDLHHGGHLSLEEPPYPLVDIAGNLDQAIENSVSVDDYLIKYHLSVPGFSKITHHPLYDAAAAAAV